MNVPNNSRRLWPLVFTGMLCIALPSISSAQLSLATVVNLAQRNSSGVKLADADVRKAEAALAQTKDVFIPALVFGSGLPAVPSVGFSGNPPSILNATVQSLVFSFPQRRYIQAARAGLDAASLNLKDAREQVALDASTDYIELDTVTRELQAAREQETSAQRLIAIEQQRSDAGVDPLSDLLQARLTTAQLKLRRLHLETRAGTMAKQLSTLTGLPASAITADHSSIPEIPQVHAEEASTDQTQAEKRPHITSGIESAQMAAKSKQRLAQGDSMYMFLPQISFTAEYSRDTTLLNNANEFYKRPLPANNFSSGFAIQVPLFDFGHRAKARETAADALRATLEAEQAQRQNDIQIATLTGNLRELDALTEIASLKQQIASEQLKAVQAQLELGNGAGVEPGATPQLSPKSEQLARIDERQKYVDALDSGFDLSKARLSLMRALGHMDDWLRQVLPANQPANQNQVIDK